MTRARLLGALLATLVSAGGCQLGWKSGAGERSLPPALAPDGVGRSKLVVARVPEGWHWYRRGGDLIVTRDGVFLQNILVERIHVDQVDQSVPGFFPLAAPSAKQWPLRTAKHLGHGVAAGMQALESAAALVRAREQDPAIADLEAGAIVPRSIAGFPGFEVELSFRLVPRGPEDLEWPFYAWSIYAVQDRRTPYRSIQCGLMLGDWLYAISYTAARRQYFERDRATFEAFLESLRLAEPPEPPEPQDR